MIIETTVHPYPAPPVPADKLYLGKMPVLYDPFAWFNESIWRQDSEKARKYEAMING